MQVKLLSQADATEATVESGQRRRLTGQGRAGIVDEVSDLHNDDQLARVDLEVALGQLDVGAN